MKILKLKALLKDVILISTRLTVATQNLWHEILGSFYYNDGLQVVLGSRKVPQICPKRNLRKRERAQVNQRSYNLTREIMILLLIYFGFLQDIYFKQKV